MHARVLYSAFDVVPSPKGASTHVAQFVRGLAAAGHEITLVTPRAPGLAEEETFEGARLLRVGAPAANPGEREAARSHALGDRLGARAWPGRPRLRNRVLVRQ